MISTRAYPTPVYKSEPLSTVSGELWVKNDGASDPLYGGNKARKLTPFLLAAEQRGAQRLLTMGAAGSHHVLATAVHGRRLGLPVAALLFPHAWSQHAENNLRATLALGLEAIPVTSPARLPAALLRHHRRGDYVIPLGGWGLASARTYTLAVAELANQIRRGDLPEPDSIVVAVGTGTTAAGILAGVIAEGLKSRVVGVNTSNNPASYPLIVGLAQAAHSANNGSIEVVRLAQKLVLDTLHGRPGYGIATTESERALKVGRQVGLGLDPTYTAKAVARALAEVNFPGFHRDERNKVPVVGPRRTLYWHTLSEAPLGDLLASAAGAQDLNPTLRALFYRGSDPVDRPAAHR